MFSSFDLKSLQFTIRAPLFPCPVLTWTPSLDLRDRGMIYCTEVLFIWYLVSIRTYSCYTHKGLCKQSHVKLSLFFRLGHKKEKKIIGKFLNLIVYHILDLPGKLVRELKSLIRQLHIPKLLIVGGGFIRLVGHRGGGMCDLVKSIKLILKSSLNPIVNLKVKSTCILWIWKRNLLQTRI